MVIGNLRHARIDYLVNDPHNMCITMDAFTVIQHYSKLRKI